MFKLTIQVDKDSSGDCDCKLAKALHVAKLLQQQMVDIRSIHCPATVQRKIAELASQGSRQVAIKRVFGVAFELKCSKNHGSQLFSNQFAGSDECHRVKEASIRYHCVCVVPFAVGEES